MVLPSVGGDKTPDSNRGTPSLRERIRDLTSVAAQLAKFTCHEALYSSEHPLDIWIRTIYEAIGGTRPEPFPPRVYGPGGTGMSDDLSRSRGWRLKTNRLIRSTRSTSRLTRSLKATKRLSDLRNPAGSVGSNPKPRIEFRGPLWSAPPSPLASPWWWAKAMPRCGSTSPVCEKKARRVHPGHQRT
jgi:hypothetical protein